MEDGRSDEQVVEEMRETNPLLGEQARNAAGLLRVPNSSVEMQRLSWAVGMASLALSAMWMIHQSLPYGLNIFGGTFAVSKSFDVQAWGSYWIPLSLILMSAVIPAVTCWDLFCLLARDNASLLQRETRARLLRRPAYMSFVAGSAVIAAAFLILRGVVCFRMLSLMPGALAEVAPDIHSRTISIWPASSVGHTRMPFGLPHDGPYSYGLFRVMTGIGQHGEVARPELVVEVQNAQKGVWSELQFPYKPGDVSRRPPLVAPYQPRLDWQMWFQALYTDNGLLNDWFTTLIDKISDASPPVLALLDTASFPDTDIKAVRVKFYSYNFSHYGEGGAWWHRTPRSVMGEEFDYSKELAHPVNLSREVQKALRTWHQTALYGLAALAFFLCIAPFCLQRVLDVKRT